MINNEIVYVLNKYTRLSRLYASNGTTLKKINHSQSSSVQDSPLNGDKLQMFFICDGTETKLDMYSVLDINCGIFDLYINNVLDSSSYDEYAAVLAGLDREITLTQPIKNGLNTIELRVNSKNVASSNYAINLGGTSLQ